MHKIVIDFDFTILAPLLVFLLIALWNAIQAYRWPTDKLLDRRPPQEETQERTDWEYERRKEKRNAKTLIVVWAIALSLLCPLWLLNDRWKLEIAFQVWQVLRFFSFFAFLFATLMAWHYARRQERLKLIACLLAMLLIAASAEHLFHQTSNTGRIVCPGCDDDQSDDQ
jgi:hypothetical protein